MNARFKIYLLETVFLLGTPAVYAGTISCNGGTVPVADSIGDSNATLLSSQGTAADKGQCTQNGDGVTAATQGVTTPSAWSPPFANSQWVSYANTFDPLGGSYVNIPNSTTVPAFTYYQDFTLPSNFGQVSGDYHFTSNLSVMVLADDEVTITLGNVTFVSTNNGVDYNWSTSCNVNVNPKYTCVPLNNLNQDLLNGGAAAGPNELIINVYQLVANTPVGLDYSFDLSLGPVPGTPEPATFVLVGVSVLGLGILRFRKRRVG